MEDLEFETEAESPVTLASLVKQEGDEVTTLLKEEAIGSQTVEQTEDVEPEAEATEVLAEEPETVFEAPAIDDAVEDVMTRC